MLSERPPFRLQFMESVAQWFETHDQREPWGLLAGLGAVALGQVVVILYHVRRRSKYKLPTIQGKQPPFELSSDLASHLGSPESIFMLATYLSLAWFGLLPLPFGWNQLPPSYFNWSPSCNPLNVMLQLLVVDLGMFLMHLGEHKVSTWFYGISHKPHHKWVNPQLFNAFNGTVSDTFTMILVCSDSVLTDYHIQVPLHMTCQVLRFCSLWDYITFGVIYANYLMLIHSEYPHAWDPGLRFLGIGTPADHHVHHAKFLFNFGHIFTYWDRFCGSYKNPAIVFGSKYLTLAA